MSAWFREGKGKVVEEHIGFLSLSQLEAWTLVGESKDRPIFGRSEHPHLVPARRIGGGALENLRSFASFNPSLVAIQEVRAFVQRTETLHAFWILMLGLSRDTPS